jgi:hypothetical protein
MPSSRLPNSQNPAGAVNPSHRPPSTVQSGPDSICTTADPWLWDKVGYVGDACRLAVGYTGPAVGKRLGEDFEAIIQSLVPMLLAALAGVLTTTLIGAGIGSLAGGVGAAPGALAGFQVGLWLLNFVGLGFLAVYIIDNVGELKDCMSRAVTLAWNSCGDPSTLDASARQFAEAVAIFFSLLVQAAVVFLTKEAARGRPAAAIERFTKSRLAKWAPGFTNWLGENFGRLRGEQSPPRWRVLEEMGDPVKGSSFRDSMRVRVRNREFLIERNKLKLDKEGKPIGPALKHMPDVVKQTSQNPWSIAAQTDVPMHVIANTLDNLDARLMFKPPGDYKLVRIGVWEINVDTTNPVWRIYHIEAKGRL